MAQKKINYSFANDGLGDPLRQAFVKSDDNFDELYANKVDKVTGKSLTDVNFSAIDKAKLDSIDPNASSQSDFAINDPLNPAFIKNKPTLLSQFDNNLDFVEDVTTAGVFGRSAGAWTTINLTWIKSNESLSLAQRKGDVLYGILDQYTGEEMTLLKVTGTPTVDGVIYFQLGIEFFKRNYDSVNVRWFGAKGDGTTNDSPAFDNAVSAIGEDGNIINIPNGYNFVLNTSILTGTKKVIWKIGASKITCPQGHEAFILQSNGSQILGSGRNATIFVMRTPSSPITLPMISMSINSGNVSVSSFLGGSGIETTPLVLLGESPDSSQYTNDAAIIATVSSGAVSNIVVASSGENYVTAPSVTYYGGGAAAIKIDGVQSCSVGDFSIDFANIPNSVGVFHSGGWWADISNISAVYNTSNGVSSEHSTTIGLVVNSYSLGSAGATGSYGGVYVSKYKNLRFNKKFIVGHDSSTVTTLQFDTCDFINSYFHGAVGITEINAVAQGDSGSLFDLVNVDGLTLLGGDFEGTARWFHLVGSCNNIKAINTLAYSASGERFRGKLGVGNLFDFAKTNSTDFTLKSGSLSAGVDYINSGFRSKHRQGISYGGDTFIVGASNIKPISETQGKLDDKTQGAAYLYSNTSAMIGGRYAYSNIVDEFVNTSNMFEFSNGGLDLRSGSYKIGGSTVINADNSITTNSISNAGDFKFTGGYTHYLQNTSVGDIGFKIWNGSVDIIPMLLRANNTIEITGIATAPTATAGTNTTQIATTAFVLANTNANAVLLTGNQTINGTKTFSAPVVVPDAIVLTQAVNKGQLDSKALYANQTITSNKSVNIIEFVNGNELILSVNATSGNITITLPTFTALQGYKLTVKKMDSSANSVLIQGVGGINIDGASTLVVSGQYSKTTVGANLQQYIIL